MALKISNQHTVRSPDRYDQLHWKWKGCFQSFTLIIMIVFHSICLPERPSLNSYCALHVCGISDSSAYEDKILETAAYWWLTLNLGKVFSYKVHKILETALGMITTHKTTYCSILLTRVSIKSDNWDLCKGRFYFIFLDFSFDFAWCVDP